MKKLKIRIGELFEKYSENNKIINDITNIKSKLKIKSESGNLINICGLIKKEKCKIYLLKFSNNITLKCADKHLLKINNSEFKYAKDLDINEKVISKNGYVELKSKEFYKYDYVYDISMEKEHVYTTPNGLIHHNSMLAMQCIAAGQKIYKGLLASFLDSEEATTSKRLYNLGVRYPPVKPYNDLTIEKLFKHIETMCVFKEQKKINDNPSIIVWDSIANTLSEKEREAEDVNSVIGYKARVLSLLTPKYVAKCAKHGICLIAINQLRDKLSMGPFSAPKTLRFLSTGKSIPGGNTILFNAFTLLEVKAKAALDPEKYGFEGIMSSVTSVKNKLFSPNVTVELIGNFQTGFSNFRTSYYFLAKHKRLISPGGWCKLVSNPEMKFRSKGAEIKYNEDEEFRTAFDKEVKECIQTEIIDRYDPEIK